MANPLLKRVKIGTFWQDIFYENLPMLCYKCGRLGHREPHCSEGTAEPTTMPPQESNPHVQAALPLEPTHVSIPWKTVQTHRTHAHRCPSKPTPRPTSTMHLIDLGYGFFIMHFDVLKRLPSCTHGWTMVCGRPILTHAGMGSGLSPAYCQNLNHSGLDPFGTITYRILSPRVSQTCGQ